MRFFPCSVPAGRQHPLPINNPVGISMTKLYVGNLPFSANEDTVRALFAQHGTVETVSLINDRDTGKPRGFGFVQMPDAEANKAMNALNGADFGGRRAWSGVSTDLQPQPRFLGRLSHRRQQIFQCRGGVEN